MSRIDTALANIRFARFYTLRLLDSLPPADWFRMPPGGVSHVGWQVGHLAFAQYRLVLLRVRGSRPDDPDVLPERFLKQFGAGSVADPDPSTYPTVEEVRAVFDRVHDRVLADLPGVPDADLDSPPLLPHPLCQTKLESLRWCAHHEGVHAGQIGLIRRQLGHAPQW